MISDVLVNGFSVGVVSTYTFSNVTSDCTISATFTVVVPITQYTITVSANTGGSISPTSAIVDSGGSQTFTITPDSGYVVYKLIIDGTSVNSATSYTFENVGANHSISVQFARTSNSDSSSEGPSILAIIVGLVVLITFIIMLLLWGPNGIVSAITGLGSFLAIYLLGRIKVVFDSEKFVVTVNGVSVGNETRIHKGDVLSVKPINDSEQYEVTNTSKSDGFYVVNSKRGNVVIHT